MSVRQGPVGLWLTIDTQKTGRHLPSGLLLSFELTALSGSFAGTGPGSGN